MLRKGIQNICASRHAMTSVRSMSTVTTSSTVTLPKSVGVIGAGQMGSGIAYVSAVNAKIPVLIMDPNATQLTNSVKHISDLLDKKIKKQQMTVQEKDEALSLISTTTQLSDFNNTPFVIEAATENTVLKQDIFKQLSLITDPGHAILASNTSSISITLLGGQTQNAANVIGMHFMNPVPVMRLVEIINGLATSQETFDTTVALAKAMGKVTTVSKDSPGFIANRILMPYINEAIQCKYEGIASVEDIDETMKGGTNVPMGPLTLADFIGLDTCLAIMRVLHNEFGDSKYRPSPLLVKMVEAGWLGKKTGKGFYTYEKK